jgi:hypothetical protein
MYLKKRKTSIDEISVLAIFHNLWKDKVLILIISLLFSCLFGLSKYYYNSNHEIDQSKLVNTKLILKSEPSIVNSHFKKLLLFYDNLIDVSELEFKLSSSPDIIVFFQLNNDKFIDFKSYFEESNISEKNYFSRYFKTKQHIYYFQYPEHLNGELFLKEYVISLFKQSQINLTNDFKKKILFSILNYEKNIEFLNKFNFKKTEAYKDKKITQSDQNSLIQENYNLNNKFSVNRDFINMQISILNGLLAHVDTFDFEPIIELQSSKSMSVSPKNFALIGLMFGFFLALIIVFFKNLIKKD